MKVSLAPHLSVKLQSEGQDWLIHYGSKRYSVRDDTEDEHHYEFESLKTYRDATWLKVNKGQESLFLCKTHPLPPSKMKEEEVLAPSQFKQVSFDLIRLVKQIQKD